MKLLATLFLFFSFTAAAGWVTNKDHSEIFFKVPYMGVGEVTGRFNDFTANANFSEDGTLTGNLSVKISMDSIDTGNRMRDGHLKGEEFFKVARHPHMTFESRTVTMLVPGKYRAQGTLKMNGISRLMVVDFTVSKVMKDTWGHLNRFVKFSSTVKRSDFGINWNKTLDGKEFLLGDRIAFSGSFQLQPAKEKTPNSKHMIPDTEYIRERDRDRWEGKQKELEEESSFSKALRKMINGK